MIDRVTRFLARNPATLLIDVLLIAVVVMIIGPRYATMTTWQVVAANAFFLLAVTWMGIGTVACVREVRKDRGA